MHVLHTLVYEPDGYGLRQPLVDGFHAFDTDLLALDYVTLDPKWRGLRVGLLAAKKVIDVLGGGCGLAVSDIAPLRHQVHGMLGVPVERIPKRHGKVADQAARRSLRRYFR